MGLPDFKILQRNDAFRESFGELVVPHQQQGDRQEEMPLPGSLGECIESH